MTVEITGERWWELYALSPNLMLRAEYFGTFTVTEPELQLVDLARAYHEQCEAYDRTVCTGPISKSDGIMPATNWERILINRNAIATRKRLFRDTTYTPQEIQAAIANAA